MDDYLFKPSQNDNIHTGKTLCKGASSAWPWGPSIYSGPCERDRDGNIQLWPSMTGQDWRGELAQKAHKRKINVSKGLCLPWEKPLPCQLHTQWEIWESVGCVTDTESSNETVRWWLPPYISEASRRTAEIKTGNWIQHTQSTAPWMLFDWFTVCLTQVGSDRVVKIFSHVQTQRQTCLWKTISFNSCFCQATFKLLWGHLWLKKGQS